MTTDPTDDALTMASTSLPHTSAAQDAPRLVDGQDFGAYRILRLLGRGGMGEVYEAEHREHGRRVALKVLNQRLAGHEDRARFLREGQLVARINHPHTVYVFGSEEVAGTPVIVMELVAGGTLKDRVDELGPFAPARAVDAVLEIVAGLEAAHAQGILHRDVKPSNCFVGADGSVKVGDFGLSIPVQAPDVTQVGSGGGIQGTPQYAAPEQLRGQALDVRADIYAVGATLYYLLTGRPPIEDASLVALLTRVATEAPEPPRRQGVTIPAGLTAVVMRCLAKDPALRPGSYGELRTALHGFSSAVPEPARLSTRTVAGAIDWLVVFLLVAPVTFGLDLRLAQGREFSISARYSSWGSHFWWPWSAVVVAASALLYYALLEGRSGRSIGKRVCGLAVIGAQGEPVNVPRALLRAVIYLLPMWVGMAALVLSGIRGEGDPFATATPSPWSLPANWLANGLVFCTMRRRNGFATLHDLASGTRVVVRPVPETRAPVTDPPGGHALAPVGVQRLGPFEVRGLIGEDAAGATWQGFDPVLVRPIWIRVLPAGSPAVGQTRAVLGRPGRLRWVTGRRAPDEAWDAYEAPDGAPLSHVITKRQPWQSVRHWLVDVSAELASADEDGTTPALGLDRVWITSSGRARLLDFRAPALPGAPDSSAMDSGQPFLADIARASIDASPLPIQARATLDRLARGGFASIRESATACAAAASGPARVSPERRMAGIALGNLPLIFASLAMLAAVPTAVRALTPGFMSMATTLVELRGLESASGTEAVAERSRLQVYLVDRFGAELRDAATWKDPRTAGIMIPLRPVAERALAAHPVITAAEHAEAERTSVPPGRPSGNLPEEIVGICTLVVSLVCLVSAVAAGIGALAFRGGLLLRWLGMAIVDRRGVPASRMRALARALVAWAPVWMLWLGLGVRHWTASPRPELSVGVWPLTLAAGALVAGAIWTVASLERGPLDRLTGTHLVPR